MSYIHRTLEEVIKNVSTEYGCLLLTGPRQVGKTTMLEYLMQNTTRKKVTLDDLEERKLAKSDPALFLDIHSAPLLIDEVQYAPELFSYLKMKIDDGAAPGSYWMTGSQSFRLMDLAQESLAGRCAIIHMSALSQSELYGTGRTEPFTINSETLKNRAVFACKAASAQDIYERIWEGAMPGYRSGKYSNRDLFYASYVQSYIDRDVADMLSKTDKLLYADFIRAAACRIGQVLNIHDIAQDVGISDDTAKRWLAILEKSEIIFYLRPYSNNLLKRTIKTPKMYFFDTGLVVYLTKYSSPEILMNGAINGAILENYAVAEIIKTYRNSAKECYMHYYRDKDSNEIDLVIESDGELHPIEIKKTASPGSELARAFRTLDKGSVPRGTGAVLCLRGEMTALRRDAWIIPIWMI